MEYKAKILMTEFVTHDVKRFVVEKPEGYKFIPGQATLVSINKLGWKDKKHPFTFTSLNDDLVLEFIIKIYLERKGLTKELNKLNPGDRLIIGEPFGTINYKGKGVFIAGGAGITPFIAIFRQLNKEGKLRGNSLIFSNKKQEDIILEKELKEIFRGKENLILTLTEEEKEGYNYGKIDLGFIKKHIKDFNQNFYICGPLSFVEDISRILGKTGVKAEAIVFEGKGKNLNNKKI